MKLVFAVIQPTFHATVMRIAEYLGTICNTGASCAGTVKPRRVTEPDKPDFPAPIRLARSVSSVSLRLLQNAACRFPARRSSEGGSQHNAGL